MKPLLRKKLDHQDDGPKVVRVVATDDKHDKGVPGLGIGPSKSGRKRNKGEAMASSLFLDFPCITQTASSSNVKEMAWCEVEAICAIITEDNRLSFYLEEGVCLEECRVERTCEATVLAWQPRGSALATGWEDGHVATYAVSTRGASTSQAQSQQPKQSPKYEFGDPNSPDQKREQATCACKFASDRQHSRSAVRAACWNGTSGRLATCDAAGRVVVWKADGRGNLSELKEYVLASAVTCALFAAPRDAPPASARLFVGTKSGSLHASDDFLGQCREVQSLGARVDHLMVFELGDRLVVLTRNLLLAQFSLENSSDDGRVVPVMKMKVSVAGNAAEKGLRHVCWAGPGVLAAATGEAMVRFFDLRHDETYVVSLTSAHLERSERTASIAFNPLQRYLAVGTRSGKVAMWRFVGTYGVPASSHFGSALSQSPTQQQLVEKNGGGLGLFTPGLGLFSLGGGAGSADAKKKSTRATTDPSLEYAQGVPTSASDWEPMPWTPACGGTGAISLVKWGPGQGVLAAASDEGAASVLSETVLHRLLRDDVGVIQTAPDAVRLERQNGAVADLRTDVSVRGLAASSKHLAVWSGAEARVYEWSEAMGETPPNLVAQFPARAGAMALRDETLYRTAGTHVELCNLQGVVKQKISFSLGEGSPTHLDVNGTFLAVLTDAGLVKLFQIDRREPKLLGSPGRFSLLVGGDAAATTEHGKENTQFTKNEQQNQKKNSSRADRPRTSRRGQPLKGGGSQQPAVDTTKAKGGGENDQQATSPSKAKSRTGRAVRSIRCNADGTRVSILADAVHGASIKIREPDPKLYVYDSDRDVVDGYDFGSVGRYPVSHFWDPAEPKLLACETRSLIRRAPRTDAGSLNKKDQEIHYETLGLEKSTGARSSSRSGEEKSNDESKESRSAVLQQRLVASSALEAGPAVEVATLFVTKDHGVLLQDVFPLEAPLEALLGVRVPRLLFTRRDGTNGGSTAAAQNPNEDARNAVTLCGRVMRDFAGLDDADEQTRAALLDFSYSLTIGDMDEAHRAVRLIKSAGVWENMAHMCVKTKRLDVAETCLGNMGHARGSAALRVAKKRAPEVEARCAALAMQLGLRNDAARLYQECGRFDLLNELYQAAGEWVLALETAETKDRIHLKSTHHRYALHLESKGDYDAAARHFELAETHRREVPRMLVARGENAALERYVMRSEDTELFKWFAGYCESHGHFDSARTCYERANDYYNLVRLACIANDVGRAADLVDEGKTEAGAYHLARHLEGQGDVNAAIQYFAKSGCYNHAIRLARQFGLDSDLMQFCIKARPSIQVDCASYFENKGEFEKAVELYHKGGELAKALDLCFKVGGKGRSQMFEALANVSKNLDENASPATLEKCADFFIEHKQYADAVDLLVKAKKYLQAITICVDHRVIIDDALAEDLTPPADDDAGTAAEEDEGKEEEQQRRERKKQRTDTLLELAKALKKQNSFQLAAKKYTQAGDRPRALRCLLKSGDTKNVIYYASMSRNRDIYVLAANYLQSLDWQSGNEEATKLTKKIVEFYTKAKAYDKLAEFYDSFAQMEIDEYRDYEKALGALRQSRTALDKAPAALPDRDRRVAALDTRLSIVDDFVAARKLEKTDPDKMADMIQDIVQRRDVDAAIRVGDAFAVLIELKYKAQRFDEAYALIEDMRARNIALHPYLEQDLLDDVHRAVGKVAPSKSDPAAPARADDDDDIPEDDIPDEIIDEHLGGAGSDDDDDDDDRRRRYHK